jgi:hypothetical protein
LVVCGGGSADGGALAGCDALAGADGLESGALEGGGELES